LGPYALVRGVVLIAVAALLAFLIPNDVAWAVAAVLLVIVYVLLGWWLQRRDYQRTSRRAP